MQIVLAEPLAGAVAQVMFWCLRRNSADYEVGGSECPRGSGRYECVGLESGSLRFSRRPWFLAGDQLNPQQLSVIWFVAIVKVSIIISLITVYT